MGSPISSEQATSDIHTTRTYVGIRWFATFSRLQLAYCHKIPNAKSPAPVVVSRVLRVSTSVQCVASNPVVKVDFAGPITLEGSVYGEIVSGDYGWVSGDVSDDLASITFDTSVSGLDSHYYEAGISYFRFVVDNCDTAFTWSDNFFELSYVDDEQNTIDLYGVENPDDIFGPDNGACGEHGSRMTLTQACWRVSQFLFQTFALKLCHSTTVQRPRMDPDDRNIMSARSNWSVTVPLHLDAPVLFSYSPALLSAIPSPATLPLPPLLPPPMRSETTQ